MLHLGRAVDRAVDKVVDMAVDKAVVWVERLTMDMAVV
jgi:hypothetical protein